MTCMYGWDDTMPPSGALYINKQQLMLFSSQHNPWTLHHLEPPLKLLQMPGPTMSSPQSLLQRLERLDSRLKQLEEKQRLPQSYFFADLHQSGHQVLNSGRVEFDQQCPSLSSALKEVHLKGTLMDRLKTLETRILQLSTGLEKGSTASSSSKDLDEIEWVQNAQNRKQELISSNGLIREPEKASERGFLELQDQKPETKVKDSKESIGAGGKKTSTCRNKKKRLDNRWVYRRWFAIGC